MILSLSIHFQTELYPWKRRVRAVHKILHSAEDKKLELAWQ